jgi:hypothetical protein
MPWANNPKIDALRRKYNVACSVHHECDRALTEARMSGTIPSDALKDAEAKAREEVTLARDRLLEAMTEAIAGHAARELGPPGGPPDFPPSDQD